MNTKDSEKNGRLSCPQCLRPSSHCVCAYVTAVHSRTRVLILQHPEESRHALNTARLAALGLPNSALWVGEHFPDLASYLGQASAAFLLFPGPEAQAPQPLGVLDAGDAPLLIVPDGTWRKARKIVHMNPVLAGLPRLMLAEGGPSRYRVRKASEPNAVSTIEAVVRTLTRLEPEQDFEPLLRPFDALIEQQIAAMGADVYARHHAG
ncbi:DTW domain-containing protein [Pusillimonas minor]|uniref:tRNA-uridine aminocarboxypropyltransferase n=1 Tax=Pusillimonas minor TaxID=2697024 RepID=A0A842HPS3_9BURK|nr:DTW domain-containing protein [Pusillimonas minor]